jgi:hypothetical protein
MKSAVEETGKTESTAYSSMQRIIVPRETSNLV